MDHGNHARSSPRRKQLGKSKRSDERGPKLSARKKDNQRSLLERRHRSGCCKDPERCRGIGAMLIFIAIPTTIAGVILTVVAATDDGEENKYPTSFIIVGPILLILAFTFLCVGLCLYNSSARTMIQQCCSLDEPTSFCRVHCKKLSQFLKKDDAVVINQAAMKALQSEPGKPVLKRGRMYPSISSVEGEGINSTVKTSNTIGDKQGNANPSVKGVRFSESDNDGDVKPHGRTSSVDSASVLSLRHCRISPKGEPDTIWWMHNEETNEESTTRINANGDLTTDL